MPLGGAVSIVATLAEGPEFSEIEVVISDTGIGMTAAMIEAALSPSEATQADYGLGVGDYALVRRFSEMTAARIHIASDMGRGTSVTMRLPTSSQRLL